MLRIYINSDNEFKQFEETLDQVLDLNSNTSSPLLFMAVRYQNIPIVNLLLEKGSNINITDDQNSTAISVATSRGKYRMVEFLLSKGADPNIQDRYGKTPLHYVTETLDQSNSQEGDDRLIKTLRALLLDKKINVDFQDTENEYTPLMIAAGNNNLRAVNALLHSRANPNIRDINDRTAYDITTNPDIKSLISRYQSGENEVIQRQLLRAGISRDGTHQIITPSIAKNISEFLFRSNRKSSRKSKRNSKRVIRKSKRNSKRVTRKSKRNSKIVTRKSKRNSKRVTRKSKRNSKIVTRKSKRNSKNKKI
jgi:ankyrin repeat protein